MSDQFKIKTDDYEGTLEVLLELVSKKDLEIFKISISDIVISFLDYMKHWEDFDLDQATTFLLTAAMLLRMKSSALLPIDKTRETEEIDEEEELIFRLKQKNLFAKASDILFSVYADMSIVFFREVEVEEEYGRGTADLLDGIDLYEIEKAARRMVLPKIAFKAEYVAPIRVSIPQYIENIRQGLAEKEKISFLEVTINCATRIEVIAYFLALLELYKMGEVYIDQPYRFKDIVIRKAENGEDKGDSIRQEDESVEK